jgi:hypothetical protein
MRRKRVQHMIDAIRVALACGVTPKSIELLLQREYQVEPLAACPGMAHSNPHVDNCLICAPRWGWTGEEVKVT